jgi:hypothetical protein
MSDISNFQDESSTSFVPDDVSFTSTPLRSAESQHLVISVIFDFGPSSWGQRSNEIPLTHLS